MARKRTENSSAISGTGSGTAAATAREKFVPAKKAGTAAPAAQVSTTEQEEVARLAYSYWEARGFQGGSSEEDWLRAEREVRGRRKGARL